MIVIPLILNEKLNPILGSYLRELTNYYLSQTDYYNNYQTDTLKKAVADQHYDAAMSDAELYDMLHEAKRHLDLPGAVHHLKTEREQYARSSQFRYLLEAIDRLEQAKADHDAAQSAFHLQTDSTL